MPLPSDWQHRATKLQWSTNEHGDEACQFALDIPATDAVTLAATGAGDPVVVYDRLGAPVWRGRIEDPSIALGGEGSFEAAALGGWAALGDLQDSYTAVWSQTGFSNWREGEKSEFSTAMHERFDIAIGDTIRISPRKNETHGGNIRAYVVSSVPDGGQRDWNYCAFSYSFKLPTNWQWLINTYDEDWALVSGIATLAGTGAVVTGAVTGAITAASRFAIVLRYNAANAVYAGETGDDYLELSEMRLTTSNTNAISTTLTATVTNGSAKVLTVGSTARMYVGQLLTLNGGGKNEQATVTAVSSSTSVTVDSLANAPAGTYPIGTQVIGPVVYGNEVASDIADFVNSVNPAQLEAGGMITAMTTDLTDAIWEDATPSQVLNDLLPKDGTVWSAGVDRGILYFRARGIGARAWVIDVDDLTLTLSLAELVNSAYAIYENVAGEVVRSTADSDAASVGQYGLTRRRSISVKTTSATQAAAQVAALLDDKARLSARVTIPGITALYDLYGNRWPLWEVNAGRGDTITIRNVAPEVASSLDAQLTFRISRTNYDALDDTLTVELEAPTPTL